MAYGRRHMERHVVGRLGWLRATVLGANDGVLSTSSLILGVSSAHAPHESVLIAGVSGLVAGAIAMAAGEYVSVSSQSDSERADIGRELCELNEKRGDEQQELAGIYVARGLDSVLAAQVAERLMAHDALGAHSRDELGIAADSRARPIQAALASGAAFSIGAIFPLLVAIATPDDMIVRAVTVASLLCLSLLGVVGAKTGGSNIWRAAIRVLFWGALAMAVTAGIGAVVGDLL
jgi:VIT1/CCC1 family predicted Fe2+/Mn2+ transporter